MKRRHAARRILAFALSVMMVTGLLFTSAFAYDAHAEKKSVTLKNALGREITFLDLYGGKTTGRKDLNDKTTFYKDAITSNGFLQDWATIGYLIHQTTGSYSSRADGGWNNFGDGHYIDYIYDMQHADERLDWDGSNQVMHATGLSSASSLKQVQERATNKIAELINRDMGGGSYLKRHSMSALTETTQDVLYSTVTTVDQHGTTQRFTYNSFTIAFYDFQVHVLDDGDDLHGKVTYASDEEEPGLIAMYTNNGLSDATATIAIANSIDETISTSVSNSLSYTFGHSLGISESLNAKVSPLGIGLDAGFQIQNSISFSETVGLTNTKTQSTSKNFNKSSSVSMSVPAHTVVSGQQTLSKVTRTMEYDCPVGLTYKVAIFSMYGDVYDDGLLTQNFKSYEQSSFITVFGSSMDGSDAVESLYQRATNHLGDTSYDATYGSTKGTNYQAGNTWCTFINWQSVIDVTADKIKTSATGVKSGTTLIYALDDTYPMSITGATTSITQDGISTVLDAAQPLYPIAAITLNWQVDKDFELTVGESRQLNTYRVQAYDKDSVPYYGFVHSRGQWRLVGADGKEVTSSDIATMTYDSVTGQQLLTAKKAGTIYVKYFINEGVYYTYDDVESKNENISSPAYKVVISEPKAEPFNGTLTLTGTAEITTDGSYNVDDFIKSGDITLTAYDTTGKEAEPKVSWEAQELESKGFKIDAEGVMTATNTGTFHIRAYCDGIYSDWIEVIVSEPVRSAVILSTSNHYFTDVAADSWYNDAVGFVCQNGLMNGVGNNQFDPNGPITRAMMVRVLYNLAGSPSIESWNSFSDVEKDQWYARAIAWAKEKGLAEGVDAETFAPNEPLTREQMVTFICRYLSWKYQKEYEGVVDLSVFKDVNQISDWAKDFVVQAVLLGIIKGTEEGRLDPQGTATRAELAQVLYNMKDLILEK